MTEGELDQRLRMGDKVDRAALDDDGVVAALAEVRAAVEAAPALPALPALADPRPSRSIALPRYRRRWSLLARRWPL
jgi:hypothetical protein